MKFAIGLATLLACATVQAMPLPEALKTTSLLCKLSGDGRSQLTLQVENRSGTKESVEIAAGTITVGKSGARMVALREAKVEIDPGRSVEAALPAVALSAANAPTPETYELAAEKAPELQPLSDYSATHNDLPRATAQVCALLLHGDVAYPAWLGFLRQEKSAEPRPTPADIVAAVDGLALAMQFQPKREFAFAQDADFRLRAVRNPLSRAKAMQLFAMTLPDGAVPPDLGQLLHTKPGDNCPICRMRAQAAGQAGNGL